MAAWLGLGRRGSARWRKEAGTLKGGWWRAVEEGAFAWWKESVGAGGSRRWQWLQGVGRGVGRVSRRVGVFFLSLGNGPGFREKGLGPVEVFFFSLTI